MKVKDLTILKDDLVDLVKDYCKLYKIRSNFQ